MSFIYGIIYFERVIYQINFIVYIEYAVFIIGRQRKVRAVNASVKYKTAAMSHNVVGSYIRQSNTSRTANAIEFRVTFLITKLLTYILNNVAGCFNIAVTKRNTPIFPRLENIIIGETLSVSAK